MSKKALSAKKIVALSLVSVSVMVKGPSEKKVARDAATISGERSRKRTETPPEVFGNSSSFPSSVNKE